MLDFDHSFSSGVLAPDEVKCLQDIYARIAAEPWFTKNDDRRRAFAIYILRLYRRGMVIPEKLEALCVLAAKVRFASERDQDEPEQPLRGHKVLVVEDEILLAWDIRKRLTMQGAIVIGPVGSVGDAVGLIEDGRLDAALLDIALDGEMVYPVAEMLRQKNIPFAFVTGCDKLDVPPTFADVPIFPKPVDWTSVAARLVAGQQA